MLDQLVESKNNFENATRRGGYLFTTSVLVFSIFASGILWSLFAKDLNMGGDGLELSSMVAPVPVPADEPPAPEPVREVKQNTPAKVETSMITRRENLASTDEPIAPKDIATKPTNSLSRPKNAEFKIGADDTPLGSEPNSGRQGRGEPGLSEPTVIKNQTTKVEKPETDDPPPTIKKVEPKQEPKVEKPKTTTVSKGVINGTAISLPKPSYPAAAKAIHVSGDVNVQVTIDEKGNVISANAVSGPALLRQVSEQAARGAKFRPTLLSEQPVKVTGIIVYKFTAQ